MKSFITKSLVSAGSFALPFLALAQSSGVDDLTSFDSLFAFVASILNNLTVLVVSIAVLAFIYGLIKYITSAGKDEERKAAKSVMIYGIVIVFVMVSIWGIVASLQNITGLESGTVVTPPTITTLPNAL